MRSATTEAFTMLIIRDVFNGIQTHVKARATEWIMAVPMGLIAMGLSLQPNIFSTSKSYHGLSETFTERQWMWIILVCFFARIVALVVNGTFRGFRHSPHIRAMASFVCFNFWAALSYGFLDTLMNGSIIVGPACIGFWMFEGLNIYRATTDIGTHHVELKRAGKWTGTRFPFRNS